MNYVSAPTINSIPKFQNGQQSASPTELGLASSIKELTGTIQDTERALNQVLDPFGLNAPDKDGQAESGTIRSIVSSATYRLQLINAKLDHLIQHLNS